MARPLPEFLPINEWFDRPPDAFWFTHARPFSCGPDDFPGIRKRPVRLPYPGPDQEAAERFNRLSPLDKLGLAIRMALLSVPGAAGAQLAIFAEPKNVAIAAGALAIWVGSHGTPVGIVVDILMLGMGVVGLGLQVQQVAWMLTCFARGVVNAENEAQLRQASNYLSQAVAIIGVDVVVAILLKKAVFRVRTRPASQEAASVAHPASPRSVTASTTARLNEPPAPEWQNTRSATSSNNVGPHLVVGSDSVNLSEFRRLNVLDIDVGRLRPGEAGAAAEIQKYLGGTLTRAPAGTSGDFIFSSGPNVGKTVDFMLTPDSFSQAAKINQFFEKNTLPFSKTLELHVNKADFVPMDTRFLTERNSQLLGDLIEKLPLEQQTKIILIR